MSASAPTYGRSSAFPRRRKTTSGQTTSTTTSNETVEASQKRPVHCHVPGWAAANFPNDSGVLHSKDELTKTRPALRKVSRRSTPPIYPLVVSSVPSPLALWTKRRADVDGCLACQPTASLGMIGAASPDVAARLTLSQRCDFAATVTRIG